MLIARLELVSLTRTFCVRAQVLNEMSQPSQARACSRTDRFVYSSISDTYFSKSAAKIHQSIFSKN